MVRFVWSAVLAAACGFLAPGAPATAAGLPADGPASTHASGFDRSRARLAEPDSFPRFRVPDEGVPLARAGLGDAEYLAVVERGGQRRGLLVKQLSFHHVAQGKLAGEPYLVAF